MSRPTNKLLQERFAEAYIEAQGIVKSAAKKAGVPYSTARLWLKTKPFQQYLDKLKQDRLEALEAVAVKRAIDKSDMLLIFMLKSLAPEKYDDAIRQRKYAEQHGASAEDAIPTKLVLVQGPIPERLKSKTDEDSGGE
jgi:hypothetical protein